jgi:kumamolisin
VKPVKQTPANQVAFGLENRPFAGPFHSVTAARSGTMFRRDFQQISERYRFPPGFSGKGETIGILAFGGAVSRSDLARYFHQQIGRVPDLRFESVGANNLPNQDSRHDTEVTLDIQLAGGLAPGARIVTYFAPNSEQGWIDALDRAIHDERNQPSVLSISWGATEDLWQLATLHALNDLFCEAAGRGITICAASGDDGCAQDLSGYCRVTFPASSPFVLACGGTNAGADDREVVWNIRNQSASGGGISDILPRPDWQSPISALPSSVLRRRNPSFDGRQLPDVAGLASHAYAVYVGGRYENRIGGTSAVAPIWSALVARLNEGLRSRGLARVGHLHPLLYQDRSIQETFSDITSGHNDPFGKNGYQAGGGWNPCTGWGTPNGEQLLRALAK